MRSSRQDFTGPPRPPGRTRDGRSALGSRWALLVPIGLLAIVITTANVAVGLAMRADDRGATNRPSFLLVQVGQTEREVVDVLGSAPLATRMIASSHGTISCLVYRRRSSETGRFRFCFRAGILVTKSEVVAAL
jgi:hypothetical protein